MTVEQIQRSLLARGIALGPKGADGKAGAGTTKGIKLFPALVGLFVDGKVVPNTQAALP